MRGYNRSLDNANSAINRQDAADLEAAAREMLRLYPGDRVGLEYLGMSYNFRGDYAAAEQYYAQARAAGLKKSRWKVLMAYLRVGQGTSQLGAGAWAAAETSLRDALRFDDHDNSTWNNLGVALERQGKLDEARRAYERAVKLSPGQTLYRKNLEGIEEKQRQQRADAVFRQTDQAVVTAAARQLQDAVGRAPRRGAREVSGLTLATPGQAAAMTAWTDAQGVDLRGATRTSPNPAGLGPPAPGPGHRVISDLNLSAPPDPGVIPPQDQDLELLLAPPPPPPSRWPGPRRPANDPKLVNPLDVPHPLPPDQLPRESDMELLFPGLAAQRENDAMLDGLIEMTAKLPTNAGAPDVTPSKAPAGKDPLTPAGQDGPHN